MRGARSQPRISRVLACTPEPLPQVLEPDHPRPSKRCSAYQRGACLVLLRRRTVTIPGINGYPSLRLTPGFAQDQRLTHTDCDSHCNILEQHLSGKSRGRHNLLNLKDSFRFRTLFHQFEWDPKRNGHLGLMIPASQQTYPQVLWTKKAR